MNILEAIAAAKQNDTVIRRAKWPEGKIIFWKNGALHWNQSNEKADEARLHAITQETLLATDFVEA